MEIFYPADYLEMLLQACGFFCWAAFARFGWRWADYFIAQCQEFLRHWSRKKGKR